MIRFLCSNIYNTCFKQKSFIIDENDFIGLAMKPVAVSHASHNSLFLRARECVCILDAYEKRKKNEKWYCMSHTLPSWIQKPLDSILRLVAVVSSPTLYSPEGDAIFTMCTFRFKNYLPSKPFISCSWIDFFLLLLLSTSYPPSTNLRALHSPCAFFSFPSWRRLFDFTCVAVSSPSSRN